jgi:hypothetical protein
MVSKKLSFFFFFSFSTYASHPLAPSAFTQDMTPAVELLSPVKQARLTFFTDLIEQVMPSVDDQVLENDILPIIYPVLKWKRIENRDLYESAHTAVISAFLSEKPVSRELAGVYSKILIEVRQKKVLRKCTLFY